jgi:glycosyltransferase involved in cell wall biosynthesis
VNAEANLRVLWIREHYWWHGSRSSYGQLQRHVDETGEVVSSAVDRGHGGFPVLQRTLLRPIRRILWRVEPSAAYGWDGLFVEANAVARNRTFRADVIHSMYAETSFGLFATNWWRKRAERGRRAPKIVTTVHQPQAWWRLNYRHPQKLDAVDAVVVLTATDQEFFDRFAPGRVHFIRHGVDTDFFSFVPREQIENHRLLFCGYWLRDFETLATIVDILLNRDPRIAIDIVVPYLRRTDLYAHHYKAFERMARHHQVEWHSDLSDERLREMYWQSDAVLLPLLDATANNTLVEALASGVPIITNCVGGISDYTDPSFAELYPVGDASRMAEAALELLERPEERLRRAVAGRAFALKYLDWRVIAGETVKLYRSILSDERIPTRLHD